MKLSIFLFFFTLVQVSAISSYSQNSLISMRIEDVTVREAVREIEKKGKLSFFFNEDLEELNEKVSVDVFNRPVNEVLENILNQANMSFEMIKDDFIVLLPARNLVEQSHYVGGKVVDANTLEPLPGVNVVIEGTTKGTITDNNGDYEIAVENKGKQLLFSYVGYISERITIGEQTQIDVNLVPDLKQLDEVVVVGYGSMKRIDLTGSVSSVSSEQITDIPVANVSEALIGKMAGVQVKTTDGSPDAEVVIRIRGGGSVTQDNSPLFIVDGFPVESINNIPSHDIESIDVLKDASSAAIYGSRGANGVILITTKSAEAGKTTISYNGYVQMRTLANKLDVLSPYEYALAQYEYAKVQKGDLAINNFTRNFGVYGDLELYKAQEPTDWQDEMLGSPSFSQNHNLSVMGGNETTKYNFSISNVSDDGILLRNGYDRTNINFRLNHKISESLSLDLSSRLANTKILGAGTSGSANLRISHILTARPVNGLLDVIDVDYNDPNSAEDYASFRASLIDPKELVEQDYRKRENQGYYLNAGLSWSILDELEYRSEFGINYYYGENYRYYGPLTSTSRNEGSSLPLGAITDNNRGQYRWSNTLTYNKELLGAHRLNLMVGQELISKSSSSKYIRAKYFSESLEPEKLFNNIALGTYDEMSTNEGPKDKLSSFFGRVNYFLLDRYIVTFTLRADGSSKFAPGNRWGVFPSGALAWRVSDENFMNGLGLISNLKLRASIGEAGNNRIQSDLWKRSYEISASNTIGFGESTNPYYIPATDLLSNPDLKWETTITRNFGLDYGLWNNRISGLVDVYWNTTKDLLVESDIPSYLGYSKQMRNIGQTSNRGIEFSLDSRVIQKRDFTLTMSFNIGINKSKIDRLDGVQEKPFNSNWATSDLREQDDYRLFVGETVGLMYGYVMDNDKFYTVDDFESYDATTEEYVLKEGIPNDQGILGGVIGVRPGTLKLKDLNGDGEITADNDRQIIGDANPKHSGGFNINARYKAVDLSMFFNWVYGNDIYNSGFIEYNMLYRTTYGNMLSTMNYNNRYKYINEETGEEVRELTELKELNEGASIWSPFSMGSSKPLFHSGAVEDGSFLRLNTLTLGYSLPRKLISKIKMQQFRLYFTVYNAWIWTNYKGYDPEVSTTQGNSYRQLTPGVDYSAYPKSRSFVIGTNITF